MAKNPNIKVSNKRIKIEKKMSDLYTQLKQLQEECGHPNVTKEYWSDTGNYDRTQDCYGVRYNCPDCGKRWGETKDARHYY